MAEKRGGLHTLDIILIAVFGLIMLLFLVSLQLQPVSKLKLSFTVSKFYFVRRYYVDTHAKNEFKGTISTMDSSRKRPREHIFNPRAAMANMGPVRHLDGDWAHYLCFLPMHGLG